MSIQVQHPLSHSTHNPISDQFLNAKAQSSRRTTYDPSINPRRLSSTLTVVPENHHHAPGTTQASDLPYSSRGPPPAPPSAFRLNEAQRRAGKQSIPMATVNDGQTGTMASDKGKQREQVQIKHKRADWVIDLTETANGAEAWSEAPRVILVLGDATPTALAPILHDPSFSDTLLLVGSSQSLPAIEALLSPSQLMSNPELPIYPTVQPFTPTTRADDTDSHALTVLLAQATTLAQQFRSKSRSPSVAGRSRAESFASSGSNSPPSTPAMRKKVLSGLGISSSGRSSLDSNSSDKTPRAVSAYEPNAESSRPSRSRVSSFSRESIFGGLRRNSDGSDFRSGGANNNGSLFDAVINFVPSMSKFRPERALQDMLHQAVVVTTGAMPSLTRQVGKSTPGPSKAMSLSLVHVLPKTMPAPLPAVIESFLLSLLPSFQARCTREIFGAIVTTPAWLSPFVDIHTTRMAAEGAGEDASGAQVLLFGGVRCPHYLFGYGDDTDGLRPRAFISNWSSCLPMPGLLSESRDYAQTQLGARVANSTTPRAIHHERMRSSPPSIPPSPNAVDVRSRTSPEALPSSTAPSLIEKKAHVRNHKGPSSLPRSHSLPIGLATQPNTRSKLSVSHTPPMEPSPATSTAHHQQHGIPHSPPTPDLDPSISSCASSFALGETGSQGSAGAGVGPGSKGSDFGEMNGVNGVKATGEFGGAVGTAKKKGLTGWFKRSKGAKM